MTPREIAHRKGQVLAETERLRQALSAQTGILSDPSQWLTSLVDRAATAARQPVVLGAIAVSVAVVGPRRLFKALRWGLLTLPGHPLGRRALAALGTMLAGFAGRGTSNRE